MDDDQLDARTSNNSFDEKKDSENSASCTGKHTKRTFKSIIGTADILTDQQIRLEQVSVEIFYLNEFTDMLQCLKWLAKRRLIANTLTCTKCVQSCSFQLRSDRNDKYNWICSQCNFKKSVREGSFFAGSHLGLSTILRLIYLWTLGTKREDVQAQLGIKQRHTIVDWYAFIREVCARRVLDNPQVIGGLHEDSLDGIAVTIGVFKFLHSKEKKEIYWVVFGIESGTDRCFMVPFESCSPGTIVSILRMYVQPGSTVRCCSPIKLEDDTPLTLSGDFRKFARDYCISVVSAESSPADSHHEKKSDLWRLIERRCKSRADLFGEEATSVSLFQSYVQEAIWRRMYSNNLFANLLADIAVYHPL